MKKLSALLLVTLAAGCAPQAPVDVVSEVDLAALIGGETEVVGVSRTTDGRVFVLDAGQGIFELTEDARVRSFVLVDPQAQVRGYYRANNDGIADLERDIRALAAARPAGR